jgi:intron-binding protein aquarius
MDLENEEHWRRLAEQHWTAPSANPRKIRTEVIKNELWDRLEKSGFDFQSLVSLENLQVLER